MAPGDATNTGSTSPGEHRATPPGSDAAAPDADRSAAQTVPTGRVQHETLELVRRLSMIPDTGHLFFIVCCLGMAVAELLTAAAPHADEAVVLDATGEPPVEEAPPGGEAVALDVTSDGPAPVEEAPPGDEAVALDVTAAANVEDGPPIDEAVVQDTAGVNAAGIGDAPDPDQAVVGKEAAHDACLDVAPGAASDGVASDGTAEDAPSLDEPLSSAVIRDDAASDGAGATEEHDIEIAVDVDSGVWLRSSSQWTPPTLRHIPSLASPRDAVQRRHQALAPLQPELRCRDLGTLGPRGPPASRRG